MTKLNSPSSDTMVAFPRKSYGMSSVVQYMTFPRFETSEELPILTLGVDLDRSATL